MAVKTHCALTCNSLHRKYCTRMHWLTLSYAAWHWTAIQELLLWYLSLPSKHNCNKHCNVCKTECLQRNTLSKRGAFILFTEINKTMNCLAKAIPLAGPIQNTIVQFIELQGWRCGTGIHSTNIHYLWIRIFGGGQPVPPLLPEGSNNGMNTCERLCKTAVCQEILPEYFTRRSSLQYCTSHLLRWVLSSPRVARQGSWSRHRLRMLSLHRETQT